MKKERRSLCRDQAQIVKDLETKCDELLDLFDKIAESTIGSGWRDKEKLINLLKDLEKFADPASISDEDLRKHLAEMDELRLQLEGAAEKGDNPGDKIVQNLHGVQMQDNTVTGA